MLDRVTQTHIRFGPKNTRTRLVRFGFGYYSLGLGWVRTGKCDPLWINKWPCFCWWWMQGTGPSVMLDWCTVGLQTVTRCVRACVRISVWMSECVFASACAHSPVCVCACLCSACLAYSCAFAGACWCARGAPRRVGRATMPSGEEIECEVQYSLGPSSVAAAQQLVH